MGPPLPSEVLIKLRQEQKRQEKNNIGNDTERSGGFRMIATTPKIQ